MDNKPSKRPMCKGCPLFTESRLYPGMGWCKKAIPAKAAGSEWCRDARNRRLD